MNIQNKDFEDRIRIKLNGNFLSCSANMSICNLIDYLDFQANRIILEYNSKVLSSDMFVETVIKEGDNIEIVTIVGGG
uniref:thiamine biosynthesis protein S n=1 Tax=Porphyridium aerugineum TaxID=2792 RepID=UPI001FCCFC26|nr:thiamine biosynthesis protein S [Porphyridium aerugineum]UNJ17910.1 thiamine biosynthesis protein S [Porphyridium aerugineum]